ncbi:YggS family pyridoxal phosphate-dependent enzyme [Alteromonadaceae bacterium BrNp21-10]|nr:YggS family pyridoxal phosphate-dependent enzyme [Alteromonadaceae bacterium BrNp21-10]
MKTIAERFESVYQAIRAHADQSVIELLAVSKRHPAEAVRQAYALGQRHFGENYAQEGVQKIIDLADLKDTQWHFIGPLQSNKTRQIAEHFDWVQSVDREKIAQRLNQQRPAQLPPLNICLQVNISQEAQKSGADEQQLLALAATVNALPQLTLRGLMCIGSATNDVVVKQQEFTAMQQLLVKLQQRFDTVDTLSMGMSGDWQQAVTAGATMIRLGTALFGNRE